MSEDENDRPTDGTDRRRQESTDDGAESDEDLRDETADDRRPATGDRPPDEMDIDELRAEIEEIDRELVELIARRTYVADTIAAVKAEKGLPTTDESQEQRVMDRAGENAARFGVDDNLVKAIFRLLIELNKIEQRENR